MTLQLGDTAPDFTAETTRGRIRFHDWLGSSWDCSSRIPATSHPVALPSSASSHYCSVNSTRAA
jgi:alkyl hydroperoxide reductase subunit AhpC